MDNKTKKEVKMTNGLSAEIIKSRLESNDKNNGDQIHITELDKALTGCTHRYDTEWYVDDDHKAGIIKLKCSICGEEFKFLQALSEDYVRTGVEGINNIIQTIKLMWLTLPENKIEEFFIMSAYLNKLPEMLKMARSSFEENSEMREAFYKKIGIPQPISVNPYIPAQTYYPQMQPTYYGGQPTNILGQPIPASNGFGYPLYGEAVPSAKDALTKSPNPTREATITDILNKEPDSDVNIKTAMTDVVNQLKTAMDNSSTTGSPVITASNVKTNSPNPDVHKTTDETKPKRKYTKKDKTSEIGRVYPRE